MPAIALDLIRTDGGTQARVSLDDDAVAAYAEAISEGAKFPPIDVFHDGSAYWLGDGFHRFFAHREAGATKIACKIHQGTKDDALLFAVGANVTHGVRRTNADKRHAIKLVLASSKWAKRSDRWIAEKCGVHHDTVAVVRSKIAGGEFRHLTEPDEREGQDGKSYPVAPKQIPTPATGSAPTPRLSGSSAHTSDIAEDARQREVARDTGAEDDRGVEDFDDEPAPPSEPRPVGRASDAPVLTVAIVKDWLLRRANDADRLVVAHTAAKLVGKQVA